MRRFSLPILIVAIATTVSCNNDDGPAANDLDTELIAAIESSSPNGQLSGYILPEDGDLASIPQDPGNPLTASKVELGKLLFHETALGSNPRMAIGLNTYSCASCHFASAGFQANRRQGIGEGGTGADVNASSRSFHAGYESDSIDVQPIRTPTAMNAAYQENMLWNGAFGALGHNVGTEFLWAAGAPIVVNHLGFSGLESQAIGALKVHRMEPNTELFDSTVYKTLFEETYPESAADELYSFVNIGLAIGAYERTLLSSEAPFQEYLKGDLEALSDEMKRGAMIFFDKGECTQCHNGPSLAIDEFYALGMNDLDGNDVLLIDTAAIDEVKVARLGRGGFNQKNEDNYKFKVPQLYNLKDSPFYGHGGTFTTVRSVVEYKNIAIAENSEVTAENISEFFVPLSLTDEEIDDLTIFLEEALYDPNLARYEPESIPSGFCFPQNDATSKIDLGCD